jgi:glucuronate isomerase
MLSPDRALPADPATRRLAREIFTATERLPLVCMHGHVDAEVLADDVPFGDPAALFITPDHYVTRLIHAAGVPLTALGVGAPDADPREIWRTFCAHWKLFRGTPSRFWLLHELTEVFGVEPAFDRPDELYDALSAQLARPEFRPRALFARFGIEILATTDSPLDDLAAHARLAKDGFEGRVVPTFRPDALVHVDRPGWAADVAALGALTGVDTGSFGGFVAALAQRRRDFVAAGALATDHGHLSASTEPLADPGRVYAAALAGTVTPDEALGFAAHMLFEMARMSCDDGLVMQLHPGVLRNYDRTIFDTHGPDKGFDIPIPVDFTRGLRPLLEAFGRDPRLRMVAFTVDETSFSRELAPLAGVYPALRLGAPWWFLDSPNGLRRFREAVTETAGFYNTAGFVDDTRAFASIPARHDLARRIDAGYLGARVAEHLLDLDEAIETAIDLAYEIPRTFYARR